jgi:hypothetical protein
MIILFALFHKCAPMDYILSKRKYLSLSMVHSRESNGKVGSKTSDSSLEPSFRQNFIRYPSCISCVCVSSGAGKQI